MHLPIFYPLDVQTVVVDGKEKTDTIYHTLPEFQFTDQSGMQVSKKDLNGNILVADFFFSTCPSICPKMMTQMKRVQDETIDIENFIILSHSVNPKRDTVEALWEYGELVGADPNRWHLLTGAKNEIYDVAMEGYKLAADEDPRAPGGFLHSELFVLADRQQRIRGYYDGTDSIQVDKLINDIKILQAEYVSRQGKPKIEQKH